MLRSLAVVLVAVLCAGAGPALADPGNPVVASADGAALTVHDSKGRLCVGVARGDVSRSRCEEVPSSPRNAILLDITAGGTTYVGLVVAAAVTQAEVELRGVRTRFDTTAGEEYRGAAAGKLRFLIAPVATASSEYGAGLWRFYDASGALVGAATVPFDQIEPVAGPAVLARLQVTRGTTSRFTATLVDVLAPSPLALDRRARQLCMLLDGSGSCFDADHPFVFPPSLEVLAPCAPARRLLTGTVPASVRSVRLLLGSGRRLTRPVAALPTAFGARYAAIALMLPRGEAVRSATLLDAAGSKLDVLPVGAPPAGPICEGNRTNSYGTPLDAFFASDPVPGPTDGAVAVAGPVAGADGPRLLARDEGEYLCVGMDNLAADKRDCGIPPTDPASLGGLVRTGMLGMVVPAEVMAVRLRPARGEPTVVATTEGASYQGLYRGHVRFLLARLPDDLTRAEALDAGGAVLSRFPIFETVRGKPFKPVLSGHVPGSRTRWSLTAGSLDSGFVTATSGASLPEAAPCLGVTLAGRPLKTFGECRRAIDLNEDPATVGGEPFCRPRFTLLYGAVPDSVRSVSARLAGGGVVRARMAPLPVGLVKARAWAIALPRSAHVVGLSFRGRFGRRFGRATPRSPRVDVAPASRQCGYFMSSPF